MEKKHLFAFDLDGTIVHELDEGGRGIPPHLQLALRDLHQRHHLVVATGRRYRSASMVLPQLPSLPYVICHNGLVILNDRGEIVHRMQLPWHEAEQVALAIQTCGEFPIYVLDGERELPDFVYSEVGLSQSVGLQSIHQYSQGRNAFLIHGLNLNQAWRPNLVEVAAIGPTEAMEKLKAASASLLPPRIRSVLVRNCGVPGLSVLEFFEKASSKWTGVEWVRRQLSSDQVIAFGDDENDLEMIANADIGLAMAHAQPHILEVAEIHLDGSSGLERYLLEHWLK